MKEFNFQTKDITGMWNSFSPSRYEHGKLKKNISEYQVADKYISSLSRETIRSISYVYVELYIYKLI